MKRNILLLLFCLSIYLPVSAQDIYQPWVLVVEGDASEIEFKKNDPFIHIRRFEDVAKQAYMERAYHLELLKMIQEEDAVRFIIKDTSNNKIGLIYCFNIQQERVQIHVQQNAESVEQAEKYKIPRKLALTAYPWDKVKEILKLKDPETLSKDEAIQILDQFKADLEAILGDRPTDDEGLDEGNYLRHRLYNLMVDKGYNIFGGERGMLVGIGQYREEEEIKTRMEEITRLVEGDRSEEAATIEEDGGEKP